MTDTRSLFPGRSSVLLALSLLLVMAGCATHPKTKPQPAFYPAPPDEPRIQYLTGFSSEDELFGNSGFKNFILGPDRTFKPIGKPYGVTSSPGRWYVCDTVASTIAIMNLDRKSMHYLKTSGQGNLGVPITSAVDALGNLYVADSSREQVLMYSADETYLGAIGKKDEMKPSGVAIAGGLLYVSDLKNHAVRVYQLGNHELVRTIPSEGQGEKGKLYSPTNVAVDKQGRVYVSDTGGFCVQVFDAEGHYVRTIGQQGLAPGQFARPKGIAVDKEGRVYVADAATQVLQLFDSEGRLLMFFGDPGSTGPGATSLPAGVAVDYDNVGYFGSFVAPGRQIEYLILVANQYGNPKISVYGFLKQR
ncbi:MAG TPA: 6-bladed beta-propeller [Verrucomicrobiae bacterium]|nr:6-bladed beta-propeller [Verrucomicrobiae bacterium]